VVAPRSRVKAGCTGEHEQGAEAGHLAAIIHQAGATPGRDRRFSRDGCAGVRDRCHFGGGMLSARYGGVGGWRKRVTVGHAAPPFS